MTTIAWDGKTLASDDRITFTRDDGRNNFLKDGVQKILICNPPISIPFLGEGNRLLALACAGSGSVVTPVQKAILAGKDPFTTLKQFDELGFSLENFIFILITEKFVCKFGSPDVSTHCIINPGEVCAEGNGADVCSYLMCMFDVSPMLAVAHVSTTTPYTSSTVNWLNTEFVDGKYKLLDFGTKLYTSDRDVNLEILNVIGDKRDAVMAQHKAEERREKLEAAKAAAIQPKRKPRTK